MTDRLRLFLVEDDDDVALLMTRALESAGHQITRCRTGADALIVLRNQSFDLALLDQYLLDMAGLDLLQTLAREGIHTPTLMVTAYGDEQLATRALQTGALDYVVKDPALGFLTDLPKRVQESVTRYRLQQFNRLLIAAVESARDGIMTTDRSGTILHVNQALEQMTGYQRQELLGQNSRVFRGGSHPPEFYAGLWETILRGDSWQGELTYRRKDGSRLEVSLTISPIVDGAGQLTNFVGIHRDVTERRQLERQLLQAQKMQSIGTLASGVAHEFNNLLAGISGYAALGLEEPEIGEMLREFLSNIVTLSDRAASLTRQLLAFARKPPLSRQPLHILDLVQSTAEFVTRTLRVQVDLDLEPPSIEGGPPTVEADSGQLQQALVNLALNARDAQPAPASMTFRVHSEIVTAARGGFPESVPPGDYVVLEVIDRGTGMTPEVLSQALDPFFTTKDVGQGSGLGLPVVFGIVHAHQGFLTIATAPHQGTRVALYLPRLVRTGSQVRGEEESLGELESQPKPAPGRNILVVDDETAVLDVIRRVLESAGHRVSCSNASAEVLNLLEKDEGVELVVLDLALPESEDGALFRALRLRKPKLPILLCSRTPDAPTALQLLADGAAGIIGKPFRTPDLLRAVDEALAPRSV